MFTKKWNKNLYILDLTKGTFNFLKSKDNINFGKEEFDDRLIHYYINEFKKEIDNK